MLLNKRGSVTELER